MALTDIIGAFRLLGLNVPLVAASDISLESIKGKITNPAIALAMGAERSLPFIEEAEWCANLLDSFSESGNWAYAFEAQARYSKVLGKLRTSDRQAVATAAAASFNYFSYEQHMATRIRRGDSFAFEEAMEYLLRRGSDSTIYATLLILLDDIKGPGIETGYRIRQALWDLRDDIVDLEEDRRTVGANILLLTDRANLKKLALSLRRQARGMLPQNSPLLNAVDKEFELAWAVL